MRDGLTWKYITTIKRSEIKGEERIRIGKSKLHLSLQHFSLLNDDFSLHC